MFMKKLRALLRPYRRRLRLEALWKSFLIGLAIGMVAATIILVFFKMLYHTAEYPLALTTGGVVAVLSAGLHYAIRYKSLWKDTTACVDALGLKERVTTMFTLSEDESTISKLQREDALEKLQQVKPKQIKIRLLSRQLLAVALSLVLFGAAIVMPLFSANASDSSAITAEQNKIIEELIAALKEKVAGLEVDDNTRSQLNKVIDDLEKDLPSYETYIEKIARISKASDQINVILKSLLTKNIIGAALAKYEITKALGKAIINGDIEAVKKACEDLKKRFAETTGDSYTALLKTLSESLQGALELAKGAGVSTEDELYMAIDTFAADSNSALTNANKGTDTADQVNAVIDKAMNAIIAALGKQNEIESAMKEINELIEDAKDELAALEQQAETSSSGVESGSSQPDASEPAETESRSPAESEPPEGTESDTPPDDQSGMPDGDIPEGTASGNTQEAEKEKIYDPDSGAVPYEDVYDEYYADALAELNEQDAGSDQKDVVKDYFNALK